MSVAVDTVVLLINTEQKGRGSPVSASFTVPVSVAVCATASAEQSRKNASMQVFFTGVVGDEGDTLIFQRELSQGFVEQKGSINRLSKFRNPTDFY